MDFPVTDSPLSLFDAAVEFFGCGVRVTPVKVDGTKAPILNGWQDREASLEDIVSWFGGASPRFSAMGVVTGPTSGNLEMLEIEGEYLPLMDGIDGILSAGPLAEVWDRLNSGWVEVSPSGGVHWFYRVDGDPVPGNTKLAQDVVEIWDEDRQKNIRTTPTIAETRGAGGQTVVYPTGGHAHPSGEPWRRTAGGPKTIPVLTPAERDDVHSVFRSLDRRRAIIPDSGATRAMLAPRDPSDGVPPGADFERVPWEDILIPAGWTLHSTRGREKLWTRPGKLPIDGISASTGYAEDRDRLFVFSSSTEFENETPYTKFGAFAVLNHDGDYSAAASALRNGVGTPQGMKFGSEESTPHVSTDELMALTAGSNPAARATGPAVPSRSVAAGPGSAPNSLGTGTAGPAAAPVSAPSAGSPAAPLASVTTIPTPAALNFTVVDRSDDGNALALISQYGDRIRYCADRGKWLHWNGQIWEWQPSDGGVIRELAKDIGRSLPNSNDWITHKKKTLSAKGIGDMLTQARTDPRVAVRIDDLDARPLELNTPGGIVDLRTGALMPSNPDHLHTRLTAVTPDPKADRSKWLMFLEDTFAGDQEMIGYFQRLAGYSATGIVSTHVLPFAHGSGGNGKGVALESLRAVLGDYSTTSPNGFLMASKFPAHTTEIARLSGARLVLCSEVNEDDRFDEAKVKMLTGGDTLTARFMRKDDFTFRPTHKLWLMGNHKPSVKSGGRSFWRRLRLLSFTHEVPADRIVEGLQDDLSDNHGPAILAWILEGTVDYLRAGMREPASVLAATAEYSAEVDTVGRFLEEKCFTGDGFDDVFTTVADVRAAYETWCDENGEYPSRGRAFTNALSRKGIKVGREVKRNSISGARQVQGLALRNSTGSDAFTPGGQNWQSEG